MVRHGESEWNQLNLFCGWFNANLSDKGIQEAADAGKAIKDAGLKFDVAHTSVLKRANMTLDSILKVMFKIHTKTDSSEDTLTDFDSIRS